MFTSWRQLLEQDEGATAVEYAVLLALILLAVLSGIGVVGGQAGGMWGDIKSQLDSTPFGS